MFSRGKLTFLRDAPVCHLDGLMSLCAGCLFFRVKLAVLLLSLTENEIVF
jgi:hypothetical protein